jgi:hypothetical protein
MSYGRNCKLLLLTETIHRLVFRQQKGPRLKYSLLALGVKAPRELNAELLNADVV